MNGNERSTVDVETASTCTTVSSSGMANCDVAVLCYSEKLKNKVETQLRQRNYSVAECLIAGRGVILNQLSSIKHASKKVILVAKYHFEDFQKHLEPLVRPRYLTSDTTLVLIEDGVESKEVHGYLKKLPHLKLAKDPHEIARLISYYIEAGIEAEHQQINDPQGKKELFSALLLSAIINPSCEKLPRSLPFADLASQFNEKHGGFRGLQVNGLKDFLQASSHHQFQDLNSSLVTQTQSGCNTACSWIYRVNNSTQLRVHHRTTSVTNGRPSETSSTNQITPKVVKNVNFSSKSSLVERTAEWVDIAQNPPTAHPEVSHTVAEACESTLAQHMNNLDSRYAFFLVVSKLKSSEHLEALANVPWLQVYDFDSNSRLNGLLSITEGTVKDSRNLTISTLSESPKTISEKATHWVFMKGLQENSEPIFHGKALGWHRENKAHLQHHCTLLSKFCSFHKPAVVLVLWYDRDKENTRCLEWFLIQLDQAFSGQAHDFLGKVIICTSELPESNDVLQQIVERFEWENTTIGISTESVCSLLAHQKHSTEAVELNPQFPKLGEENAMETVSINKQNYAWLTDSLELLPKHSEPLEVQSDDVMKEFVKGGTLAWDETSMSTIAVERSCQKEVYDYVKREYIDPCKSAIIRIYHAPGGGGTTFGRQLLWKLRNDAPCFVSTTTTALSISGLVERIHFLHKLTLLPVVVLIDGRSDYEVELLFASTTAVIILHIQRFSKELTESYYEPGGCCYLAGRVTERESKDLAGLFSRFAPKRKSALSKLPEEVTLGKPHQVFEFGLAAFNHEFKGVRKYVRGYMEPRTAILQKWQKVVAYLSLLMVYGQCGIPGIVFEKLLKSNHFKFEAMKSLHNGRQFITNTKGYWKINYNAVAKEILEFVLTVQGDRAGSSGRLSSQARDRLHILVEELLQYIDDAIGNNAPERISFPLSQMVIKRDYDDIDVADDFGRKKRFSRLLEDIPGEENRIKVLKRFTETFPQHAELHAHLGRLYSLYGHFKEAEKAFNIALELRINERAEQGPHKTDNVRGRFHHMFGFSYIQKIRHDSDKRNVSQALATAKKAVHQFTQGRKYAVHNRSYGYIGEVRARLLIVEMFRKQYNIKDAFTGKVESAKDLELLEFVRESHSQCDRLLAECQQYTTSPDLQRFADYFTCVSSYNYYFQDVSGSLPEPQSAYPNIPLARSKIASIKMKHNKTRKEKAIKYLDGIKDKKDISEVVRLLDSTLREVFSNDRKHVSISVDMLEWLDAIRHHLIPDTYKVIDVLQLVEQWEQRNEFGLATFYYYIANFLMAVWSSGPKQRQSYFDKTTDLGKKLRTLSYHRSIYQRSRELLADHAKFTIRKILPKRHVGMWDKDKRQWSYKEAAQQLLVCTGTVRKSNLPTMGFIELDVPHLIHNRTVEVYFVPKRHDLHGRRFSEQRTRVEFYIVFNTYNGAEAEAVTKLEKKLCPTCNTTTEVITLNQPKGGKCSQCGGKPNQLPVSSSKKDDRHTQHH